MVASRNFLEACCLSLPVGHLLEKRKRTPAAVPLTLFRFSFRLSPQPTKEEAFRCCKPLLALFRTVPPAATTHHFPLRKQLIASRFRASDTTMVRGKTEIKRIDNDVSRRMSFVKRRAGLLKKANELAVLCDVDLGVLVFSDHGAGAGQPSDYCSPHTSWSELIQRYETITNVQLQDTYDDEDEDADDQMFMFKEIVGLRRERDRLQASLRRQTGEDLPSGATKEELDTLDQQLELALAKVRERKDKLMDQQLDESYHKVHILEDQNSFLRHKVTEDRQCHAAVEAVEGTPTPTPTLLFGGFFPEVEEELSTSLQLWPQQLTDVQGLGLQPSLRLS